MQKLDDDDISDGTSLVSLMWMKIGSNDITAQ
jgi:hypothetical protein